MPYVGAWRGSLPLGGIPQQQLHLAALAARVHYALSCERRLAGQCQAHVAFEVKRVQGGLVALDGLQNK